MDFQPRRKGSRTIINITPLIDCMFLLLIFLAVTSTFLDQPAIDLTLPRSATAQEAPLTPAVLYLTRANVVFLNDRPLPETELRAALRQLQAATGETRIVLRADEGASHGDVVRLIDAVKESGFSRISLSARPATAP